MIKYFYAFYRFQVNVSVDIADASGEGGTNFQALMVELKSAEDLWANQLGGNVSHLKVEKTTFIQCLSTHISFFAVTSFKSYLVAK